MKKVLKQILTITLCMTILLSMTACQKSTGNVEESSTAQVENTVEGQKITLIDQADRTITLDHPAQTIVSSYYITTYACMALGIKDRLVGIESKADTRNIYQMAAPELLQLPSVGTLKEFDVEAAAAQKPDLVILPKKLMDAADALTDLGITVLIVYPENQELLEDMLTLIATACGVEDAGEKLVSYYHDSMTEINELTQKMEDPLPKVYMAGNSSYLTAAPKDMYQSSLITLAGGENAAGNLEGDYWTDASYEDILKMNPDVMILPASAEYGVTDILNDSQLAEVTAVKNKAVYQMPVGIEEWDSPIPSGILGIRWLLSVLHEDLYSFDALKADVMNYYKTFYGYELDETMITK